MNTQCLWQQPKTIRIYLHPPFAERLIIMWPDFKISNSELVDNNEHTNQYASASVLLHGEDMEQFSLRKLFLVP